MIVFRVGHKRYATSLAASGVNGRWAAAGRPVIYCAEDISLAFLENMVRRQGVGFNDDFRIVCISIPDDLAIQVVAEQNLQQGWRDPYDYRLCQPLGNQWFDDLKIPVLKVPSAVLPQSYNYVLNTHHPDFSKIQIIEITNLVPDIRIEDILKQYPSKKQ